VKQTWGYVQAIASMAYTYTQGGNIMGLIIEVFWAMLVVGIPVAIFTLAMVWFALQRGYLQETLDTKALQREISTLSKNNKKAKKKVVIMLMWHSTHYRRSG